MTKIIRPNGEMPRYGVITIHESARGTFTLRGQEWVTFEAWGAHPARTLLSDHRTTLARCKTRAEAEAWIAATHPDAKVEYRKHALDSSINPFTGQRRPTSLRKATGVRDTQKSKVYAAERSVFPIDELNPRYRDLTACQALVDRWCASAWFRKRWGVRRVTVTGNGGERSSRGGGSGIRMLVTHRNQYTIAHEVAHCLAGVHAAHGPLYTRTYLELIRFVGLYGKHDADRLRAAFKAHKVKVAPRRPELDGRGVARERAPSARRGNPAALAAFRAAKAPVVDPYAPIFRDPVPHLFMSRAERVL